MKRNYLTVPGQKILISINGPSGSGKSQLSEKIKAMLQAEGLWAVEDRHDKTTDVITAVCPTQEEARNMYLETLGEHEIETLKGHLVALGYEL